MIKDNWNFVLNYFSANSNIIWRLEMFWMFWFSYSSLTQHDLPCLSEIVWALRATGIRSGSWYTQKAPLSSTCHTRAVSHCAVKLPDKLCDMGEPLKPFFLSNGKIGDRCFVCTALKTTCLRHWESAKLLFTSIQSASVLKASQISFWLNNKGVWLLFHLLANYIYCLWALDGHKYQGAG